MEKETGLQEKEQADMWTDIGFPINYYMTSGVPVSSAKTKWKEGLEFKLTSPVG